MRLRRIANWHRWVEAESQAAERQAAEREPARVEEAPPRFRRWTRWARPSRFAAEVATGGQRPAARPVQADGSAEAAVAMMPALGARFARPTHAAVQSRILAAAMIRHPVVPAPHPMVPPPVPAPAVLPAVIHGPRAPVRPENAALRHPRAAAVAERRDPRPAVLRPVVLKSQPAPAVAAEPAALPVPPAPAVQSPAAPADVPVAPLD